MTPKIAMTGPGYFQWNKGGWFGSQTGSMCWMLVGAVLVAARSPMIAVIWLLCFSIANAIGTGLWLRRDRVPPYPAIQILLAIVGVIGLVALVAFDALRPDGAGLPISQGELPRGYLFFLVGVPVMMVYFALMEHSARKAKARASSGA